MRALSAAPAAVSLAALIAFGASCRGDQTPVYENDPRIYFYRGEYSSQQRDSILQSFFLLPGEQERDTLYVEILTMGLPSSYDRAVKFVQTNAGAPGAAIAGVHYVPFDSPDAQAIMFVPAGAVGAAVPVILIRTEDMDDNKFRIEMEVARNEHFSPGFETHRKFMIQSTAMAERPAKWDSVWQYYFGSEWGPVKMKFIIDYVEFSGFDQSPDIAYGEYLKLKANEKLIEYNRANGELRLCENADSVHPGGEACPECVTFP